MHPTSATSLYLYLPTAIVVSPQTIKGKGRGNAKGSRFTFC
uniref:Uncharacterized protein n=1 Tax=Arundo donax TaxID=35708 RepID=A0A0A8ZZS0_ARUDO